MTNSRNPLLSTLLPTLLSTLLIAALATGSAFAGEVCQQVTGGAPDLPNPVLFVTQMPIADDFATIGSVFANHEATLQSVGRGGDLWIRYPDGQLCNLTAEAGYGVASGLQGNDAIAVGLQFLPARLFPEWLAGGWQ